MATATRHDSASGRFYIVEGQKLPSVTHIISCLAKPALIGWAANMERAAVTEAAADLYERWAREATTDEPGALPRSVYLSTLQAELGRVKAHTKQLAAASEIGTQIHAAIEWRLRSDMGWPVGPAPVTPDAVTWAVMAFEDWAKSVRLTPILVEQTVYSLTHGYAGTMDLVAEVEGRLTLVDFKSGKSVYAEAHLQTAAYRRALIEMRLVPADPLPALILRLPKNVDAPAFEVVKSPSAEELMPTFLAVLTVWKWWHAAEEAGRAAYRQKVAKAS